MSELKIAVHCRNLREFLSYRKLTTEYDFDKATSDALKIQIRLTGCIRVRAIGDNPKDASAKVSYECVILGEYTPQSSGKVELQKMLRSIMTDIYDPPLYEILLFVSSEFMHKKNMMTALKLDSAYIITPICNTILDMVVPAHCAVPLHRIMTDDEKNALLAIAHRPISSFPKIYDSDPPIVWIGGKPGDMIEIIRTSETAGTAIYHRVVISSSY